MENRFKYETESKPKILVGENLEVKEFSLMRGTAGCFHDFLFMLDTDNLTMVSDIGAQCKLFTTTVRVNGINYVVQIQHLDKEDTTTVVVNREFIGTVMLYDLVCEFCLYGKDGNN